MKGDVKMEIIFKMLEELRPEFDFRDSDNFIEDGYLDSFDLVTLISMIEEKFEISIDGLDIIPENFESAEKIQELIKKNGVEL